MANIGGSPSSMFYPLGTFTAVSATANGTNTINGVDRYTMADFMLDVTAAAGTNPTLIVRIQSLLPDGAPGATSGTWQDICAFASAAATGKQVFHFVTGAASNFAVTTGTLAAGTSKSISLGGILRVQYTIAGTEPVFSFSCYASFYE